MCSRARIPFLPVVRSVLYYLWLSAAYVMCCYIHFYIPPKPAPMVTAIFPFFICLSLLGPKMVHTSEYITTCYVISNTAKHPIRTYEKHT